MRRFVFTVFAAILCATAQGQQISIATIAPENSDWVKGMRAGMAEIKDRTDGRVTIKLFSGGIQGNDEAVLRKIRISQLHGAAFTPNMLRRNYQDIVLYNLPMVFNDVDEADYVRKRLDKTLMQGLEDAGFVSFGFTATGFSVVLSDDPIRGVEDLRGKKIWAPEDDPVSVAALKALGLNPITLPLSDVYTGLQTKLIEIMPGSAQGAVLMQWYTKVNYFTDLPLVYTTGLLVIDKRTFDKIGPEDQRVVRDVMGAFTAELDSKSAAAEAGAKEAMVNKGVKRIIPDPAKVAEIRQIVQTSNRSLARQGEFSLTLYEQMLGYINEYRREKSRDEAVAATAVDGVEKSEAAGSGP